MSNFKILLVVPTLVSTMFGTTPTFADDSHTYINGSLGTQNFDNDRLLKSESLILIGLEHRYSNDWNNWGAEIFGMSSSPARDSSEENLGNTDLIQFGIDGLYYFKSNENNRHDAIQPYGVLGLAHADFKDSGRTKERQMRTGLGLRMMLNDYWSAKADARLIYGEYTGALDNIFTIGLSYTFNDQNNKVTPIPVPSIPPIPSLPDNDGTFDYKDSCPTLPDGSRQVGADDCMVVWTEIKRIELNINFPHHSIVIGEDNIAKIGKIARFLKKYNWVGQIVLEGHADSTGRSQYNDIFSQRRGNEVMKILTEHFSIDPDRLSVKGYGEARPVESNDTKEGRFLNRRVVAVIEVIVPK